MLNYKFRSAIILPVIIFLTAGGSYTIAQEQNYTKKGWSITPLPALGYDSDLGLQLGAMADIYYFGDGSTYPEYMHKIMVQASWFTKGSGIYHVFYDSQYLIPKLRLTFAASYIPNTMMRFFGFNGYAAPYISGLNKAFYTIDRNLLRIMGDLQGSLGGNLGWAAGLSFYNFDTDRVQVKDYRDETTLYDIYVANGLIHENEMRGGNHIELRLGAVYDTRDHEPDPSKGIYSDVILYGSPDIFNGRGNDYIKLAASFRHYVPIVRKRLTLAYRISYQGTLAGSVPFYVQQNYTTLCLRQINSDILGGGISLRGVEYNRVVGDGVAWANIELRIRLFRFRLLGQEWYTAANPFMDIGMAVQPYRLEDMKNAHTNRDIIYSGDPERPHMSAGLGLKLVMNENFVLSAEMGKPFDSRDGKIGLYLNLNYIF